MSDLRSELEALRASARERLAAATDASAVDELRHALLGRSGELTLLLKRLGSATSEERPDARPAREQVRAEVEAAIGARLDALREHGARRAAGGRGDRHERPRPAASGRAPPPGADAHARPARGLPCLRLRGVRGSRGRDRGVQLRATQHSAGPPGPRPVGHPLRRRAGKRRGGGVTPGQRRHDPADPHLARPDPSDARPRSADPGPHPGSLLPLRGSQRQHTPSSSTRSRAS